MVVTLQVTLGSGVTPIIPNGEIIAKWVIFQNNAAHSMRLGDANITSSRGLLLANGSPGGAASIVGTAPISQTRLSKWNVIGTQNDLLDVIYDDGV